MSMKYTHQEHICMSIRHLHHCERREKTCQVVVSSNKTSIVIESFIGAKIIIPASSSSTRLHIDACSELEQLKSSQYLQKPILVLLRTFTIDHIYTGYLPLEKVLDRRGTKASPSRSYGPTLAATFSYTTILFLDCRVKRYSPPVAHLIHLADTFVFRLSASIKRSNRRQHNPKSQRSYNTCLSRLRPIFYLSAITSTHKSSANITIIMSEFQESSAIPFLAGPVRRPELLRLCCHQPGSRWSRVCIKTGRKWKAERKIYRW